VIVRVRVFVKISSEVMRDNSLLYTTTLHGDLHLECPLTTLKMIHKSRKLTRDILIIILEVLLSFGKD
jgi:hypothetical protein